MEHGSIYGVKNPYGSESFVDNDEKLAKLYQKIEQSKNNTSFSDLCKLAELAGFSFDRQKGSHKLYRHEKHPERMNFQNIKGEAKPYQVKQLLDFISGHNLLKNKKEVQNV